MSDPERKRMTAILYAACLPGIVDLARGMGYALAVHGSLQRDFDLIAVPWIRDAQPAERLIGALAEALSCYNDPALMIDGPEVKPHGRKAWGISLGAGLSLDVSVLPITETNDR